MEDDGLDDYLAESGQSFSDAIEEEQGPLTEQLRSILRSGPNGTAFGGSKKAVRKTMRGAATRLGAKLATVLPSGTKVLQSKAVDRTYRLYSKRAQQAGREPAKIDRDQAKDDAFDRREDDLAAAASDYTGNAYDDLASALEEDIEDLVDEDTDPDDLDAVAQAIGSNLFDRLFDRAMLVIVTEQVASITQAVLETMSKVSEIDTIARIVWIAESGMCIDCADLDGEVALPDELFSAGVDGPPYHPNCRCHLEPAT